MTRFTLDYNLEDDAYVCDSKKIAFSDKTHCIVEACTVAGSKDGKIQKPNEDAFFIMRVDQTLFLCVIDGDSSVRPIQSLRNMTGARFSSHTLCKLLSQVVHPKYSAEEIFNHLNKKIRTKISAFPEIDMNDPSTLPGSSITIVKLDFLSGQGELVSIGDTFSIFDYKDKNPKLITHDLLKKFDDETLEKVKQVAKKHNIPNKVAVKDEYVRTMIVKRYKEAINRKDGQGYGILNGQAEVGLYLQKIYFNLDTVSQIFLGTDGTVPLSLNPEIRTDQKSILKIVEKGGLAKLIQYKKSLEDRDPDFTTYIRYKHSDDATAVYIKLS